MNRAPESHVDLAIQTYGDVGNPIIILHGLLGSGRNWTTIAKRLGESGRVFAPDLRNHGGSPWDDEMSYEAMAADVKKIIEANELGPATLIGHSMGGKTAMRLALDEPSLIERLVVADIAPVAYEHSSAAYVEAMRSIDVNALSSRGEIDERLAVRVPEPGIRAFLLQNLVRQDKGFAWRPNLDVLAEAMSELMAFSSDDENRFDKPTMFLAGEKSDYVQAGHQAEISRLFPRSETRYIADASHWLHAEQPAVFYSHLQDFMNR